VSMSTGLRSQRKPRAALAAMPAWSAVLEDEMANPQVGRKTRTIPPAIPPRPLRPRQGWVSIPGCTNRHYVDAIISGTGEWRRDAPFQPVLSVPLQSSAVQKGERSAAFRSSTTARFGCRQPSLVAGEEGAADRWRNRARLAPHVEGFAIYPSPAPRPRWHRSQAARGFPLRAKARAHAHNARRCLPKRLRVERARRRDDARPRQARSTVREEAFRDTCQCVGSSHAERRRSPGVGLVRRRRRFRGNASVPGMPLRPAASNAFTNSAPVSAGSRRFDDERAVFVIDACDAPCRLLACLARQLLRLLRAAKAANGGFDVIAVPWSAIESRSSSVAARRHA